MQALSLMIFSVGSTLFAASDLPDWLQSIIDFIVQVIVDIPIIILDIIGFILKLIVAVG